MFFLNTMQVFLLKNALCSHTFLIYVKEMTICASNNTPVRDEHSP